MKSQRPLNPSAPCRHWPFWIVIAALVAVLGLSLLLNLTAVGLLAGTPTVQPTGFGEDEFPRFAETHSYGAGTTKVVRIWFTGFMTRQLDGSWFGTSDPIEECVRQIRAARQDDEVAAILLEVDSPGGEVTPADEIYHELMLFKESREDRIITVLVHDMAASGGYYIALPADAILAQPTALIGSIGVFLQTLNIQGLSEKIGVTDTTIKSGKNKDMLNPFRPVDEEQVQLLQASIDETHRHFLDLILDNRPIKKSALKKLTDGRIFTARQAVKNKLIDGIGYWEDAVEETARLLGVEEVYVVTYEVEKSFFDVLMGARTPLPGLQSLVNAASTPRRLYLWRP